MDNISGRQERFHFLDGIRGIASLMIVFHHSFTSGIAQAMEHFHLSLPAYYLRYFTQSGVELFFVLSGIVLLRPYLRGDRKFKPLNYFARRFKRIYPPYFVALLFAGFVAWYIHAWPTWYTDKPYHMVFLWREVFRESLIISIYSAYYNLSWWSLGIEVLFYLVVPLIIFILPSRYKPGNMKVVLTIIVTLAVCTVLQLLLTEYYPRIYSYNILTVDIVQSICYPVCFLMGIFLAARDFADREARLFIVSGVVLVLASRLYAPIVNPGFGLFYAGMIIMVFNGEKMKRFLSKPIMIWLGERSYSLFLVHFSVFYFIDSVLSHFVPGRNVTYGVLSRGIGLPAAFFLAMLLFHFVERRFAHGLVTANMFWPWQVRDLNVRSGKNDRI